MHKSNRDLKTSPHFLSSFFIGALFFAQSLVAQSLTVNLDWLDIGQQAKGTAVDSLSFTNCSAYSDDFRLPVYATMISLPSNSMDANVTLRNPRVDELGSHPYLTELPLKEDWIIEKVMRFNRGEPIVEISVFPFAKNSKGQIDRLVSFELVVEPVRKEGRASAVSFVDNSRLVSGTWFRIPISKDGVYKITRSYLQNLGLDTESITPDQINIYGNDEGILPFQNSVGRADDLVLKKVWFQGGDDGVFDANDQIIFYAKGPDEWDYSNQDEEFLHTKHYYSNVAYCFIGIGVDPPARVDNAALETATATHEVNSFNDRTFYENDLGNVIKSGRRLVGEKFGLDGALSFSGPQFNFENIDVNTPVKLRARMVAKTIGSSTFSYVNVACNGNSMNMSLQGLSAAGYTITRDKVSVMSFLPTTGSLAVNLQFSPGTADAEGWVDYLAFNVRRNLLRTSTQLLFRDMNSVGAGNIARFQIGNMITDQYVWDVSDPSAPLRIALELNGTEATFIASASQRKEYALFNNSNVLTPGTAVSVPNQDLHGLDQNDMVILTAKPFKATAEKFATLHRNEGLNVVVVEPQQVYNEFSSGVPDITAVKWFLKMFYDRAGTDDDARPDYLFLIGDGNYLQHDLDPASSIYLLSYQSEESNSLTESYISDDYFGLLDDLESDGANGTMDIGIGRIPVKTLQEAEAMYTKSVKYISNNTGVVNGNCQEEASTSYGAWRNKVVFVGDDQDNNIHMNQANVVSDIMNLVDDDYVVKKIFLDAYLQNATSGGARYPQAAEEIKRAIQSGALLLSYTGHGGEIGWAQERVLDVPTIQGFTNSHALPVIFTATCEFSRYDDPGRDSAGELALLNPNGGAISMFSTTRLVYSSPNFKLSQVFYDLVMREDEETYNCPASADLNGSFSFSNGLRMGDLVRASKGCIAGNNKLNFSLLGDPALALTYPEMNILTDSVLNVAGEEIGTIKALQRVRVVGHIADDLGNVLPDFNGQIEPSIYDKAQTIETLQNDGGSAYIFNSRDNLIYKGKATVTNGRFSFEFVVPKDISYVNGQGKFYYYALSDDTDAQGSNSSIFVGGTDTAAVADELGPHVQLFLDDESFVSGGLTNETPILIAKIFDDNGVNTVGNGIGHDITVTLDGNTADQLVLNDYYEADLDSYQSGVVKFPFAELSEGQHTLRFKVWDIYNNSTQLEIDFVVEKKEDLVLDHVMNYPNPFTTNTRFIFEHNRSCETLDVQVQVFTVSGKLVKTIQRSMEVQRMKDEPMTWDGRDEYGDRLARGVYMYRLKVVTPEGQKQEVFEKLVIL
jgi:hypothetical protein